MGYPLDSSRSRGKLFCRPVQQAVAVDPAPYRAIVTARRDHNMLGSPE